MFFLFVSPGLLLAYAAKRVLSTIWQFDNLKNDYFIPEHSQNVVLFICTLGKVCSSVHQMGLAFYLIEERWRFWKRGQRGQRGELLSNTIGWVRDESESSPTKPWLIGYNLWHYSVVLFVLFVHAEIHYSYFKLLFCKSYYWIGHSNKRGCG